ncbi:hypothetical protein RYX36_017693 [Vicia faba]
MPWLAIPYSDSETRNRLDDLFHVNDIPHLALLDETGKVVVEDGVDIIREYGLKDTFLHHKGSCAVFTQQLKEGYKKLKENRENFEVVFIPVGDEEESFQKELKKLPALVIIGPDGKTLHTNVAKAIVDHGIVAYPFTLEKFVELEELTKAKEASQTLESFLVSGDQDFVIKNGGEKV